MILSTLIATVALIISILLFCICVVVLFQPNAPRLYAAVVYAGLTLLHEFVATDFDAFAYYVSAALVDLLVIIFTSGIAPIPKMVITLHTICWVSMIVNFAGWLISLTQIDPIGYEIGFMVIYAWALITFIKRSEADVGGFGVSCWRSCFRFDLSSSYSYKRKHKRAT